jgi:hypothetical protein
LWSLSAIVASRSTDAAPHRTASLPVLTLWDRLEI